MPKVETRYTKTLKDGSECKLAFSIEAERMDGNVPEILSNFAQMSKSAYINLGNMMHYGTAEQNEIKQLATKMQQPAVG